ncbi:MAG: ankyrin repeat domain-containing protein [Candidatus Cardinium sp.]|uniref:ankyrin repeat domain-containing protein n=1 Tax=Cardinium endosymbiont of Dermatophagoides farinae TaxID=2597823 RepID=UPI00118448DE|nr:ankyrin repeat domain-containing protein [Cardinium endosymbiont of Dermatophagoides farinae]TSJ80655.1 ankyrin repeat domain-containing protein [Cardinium endosymbiont of Dermatophagoides farinae]UWW96650.1 MAG: ankyrin repeat domain-containing protein [Candidatus Cardinium sp.]
MLEQDAGVAIDESNRHGDTLLHVAAFEGDWQKAQLLLKDKKIDVNARNNYYDTPMHYAVAQEHVEVLKVLLEGSIAIDVNAIDKDTYAPLHYASYIGHLEMAQVLLIHVNINLNIKDKYENSPLHYAAFEGHLSLLKALLASKDIDISKINMATLHYIMLHLKVI